MIVAVCADKGSPGVTTLTLALGMAWPGERLVMEADPAGADLAFRLGGRGRQVGLEPDPSVLSLAVEARGGLTADSLTAHAQPTALGVAVLPGAPTAEDHHPIRDLWQRIAVVTAAWSGVALSDLGRLQPGHPAVPLVRAASVVLLLSGPTVEGLYRTRHRVLELTRLLGDGDDAPGVAVAIRAPRGQRTTAIDQLRRVLRAAGSEVPVVGVMVEDPAGVRALYAADLGRRLDRSLLLASVASLADVLATRWPGLIRAEPSTHEVVA